MCIRDRERDEELRVLGREFAPLSSPFPRYGTWELAERYGEDWEHHASLEHKTPFWAVSHKREFYDREDPERPGRYINYGLIYPEGFGEGLFGAEREFEYETILRKMREGGMDESRYEIYLRYARTGLVPSAGGGFGVEGLARYLTGAAHVGDVQLFKRIPGVMVDI